MRNSMDRALDSHAYYPPGFRPIDLDTSVDQLPPILRHRRLPITANPPLRVWLRLMELHRWLICVNAC